MIGFAVIVGVFVSKPPSLNPESLVLGFVTGFAICAYSMVINDYYDIEVDRVNQPAQPSPERRHLNERGPRRSPRHARGGGPGVAGSAQLGGGRDMRFVYALLSWLYNFRAKKYGSVGQRDRRLVAGDSVHLRWSGLRGERDELAPALHGRDRVPLGRREGGREGDGRHGRRREEGNKVVREGPRD